ncbi:hypothetical protein Hanom_Chr10g00876931 [Helianthus anomalus]
MFVHLTKRTNFLVHVRLFNKQTNTNELPAERFTNCSPNVWFISSPNRRQFITPNFSPNCHSCHLQLRDLGTLLV